MTITVLGCGWLGLPLAKELIKDHKVKGSTTSSNKLTKLRDAGIAPYLIKVDENSIDGDLEGFLDSDCLFINIPPNRKDPSSIKSYPTKIENIIRKLSDRIQKVIFISSTGVYNDTNVEVDERHDKEPKSKSGKAVRRAENIIQNSGKDWIVLRMAGLIGLDRDPGKWFAGKSNILNGLAPVNLVHLDDCIEVIKRIISSNFSNEILNVCSDSHPPKAEFYTAQSKRLGLELPQFKEEVENYKIVSNQKIKKALDYQFIHSDLMHLTSEDF